MQPRLRENCRLSVVRDRSRDRHWDQIRDRLLAPVRPANPLRSVVLVAPTSRRARGASFRPEIEIESELTKVLVEQVGAVDLQRLRDLAGHLSREEQWGIDELVDIWRSDEVPLRAGTTDDPTAAGFELMPAGSLLRIIDLAPTGGAEPMWHQTASVDFVYIATGSCTCLYDGGSVQLNAGDTMVQQAVRHA